MSQHLTAEYIYSAGDSAYRYIIFYQTLTHYIECVTRRESSQNRGSVVRTLYEKATVSYMHTDWRAALTTTPNASDAAGQWLDNILALPVSETNRPPMNRWART
jgi:hypothetical protein